MRAYCRIGEFQPDRPFARWLFVIARNASLDAIRRRRRAAEHGYPTIATVELGPEDVAMQNDEAERIRTALATLPPKYRNVLELYYLSGLRYREIAVVLDIPIGTVKTYIARAKRRLRETFVEPAVALAA